MSEDHLIAEHWDCRWPDPVALRVASQRILDALHPERTDINRQIVLQVEMEGAPAPGGFPNALLITPWAVERVYWSPFGQPIPPIRCAQSLTLDPQGRIATGQGVLLLTEPHPTPVLIAWEPETGHHFIQSLVTDMRPYADGHQAIMAAYAPRHAATPATPTPPEASSPPIARPISRRGLLGFFR